MKFAIYFLTCEDSREADAIANELLDKKLIACAKKFGVESRFWWQNKKDKANEIVMMLESTEEKFEQINEVVKKLSSYETYILFSIPVTKTTPEVEEWLSQELK